MIYRVKNATTVSIKKSTTIYESLFLLETLKWHNRIEVVLLLSTKKFIFWHTILISQIVLLVSSNNDDTNNFIMFSMAFQLYMIVCSFLRMTDQNCDLSKTDTRSNLYQEFSVDIVALETVLFFISCWSIFFCKLQILAHK